LINVGSALCDQGLSGGTTVSATMTAAHMAGVEVFITGGIGGVHRDFHTCALTISTDLLIIFISFFFV